LGYYAAMISLINKDHENNIRIIYFLLLWPTTGFSSENSSNKW